MESNKEEKVSGGFISPSKVSLGNPWMVSTIVLGVIALVLIGFMTFGGVTGNVVSEKSVSDSLVSFVEAQGGSLTVLSTTKESGMYKVTVSVEGQEMPVYVSLDGKYLIPSTIPLTADAQAAVGGSQQEQAPVEVPKSDKPVADFYVFSYCPYGTQMEKALVPVYNLLKSKADINIVAIGAMHGEYERQESLRQLCIQKNYGKDKLFAYLDKFLVNAEVGKCNGNDACVVPLIEAIYTQIGIDKSKINTCMPTEGAALYTADGQKAASLGISGSPSVTINGVNVQVGRSPALVQQAICSAFNVAPSECSQNLSSASASAGFGSTASSGSTASCG
ncbi:MAG: hypothetical protein AABX11_00385 [Nanoarchaeota archaeon]